MKDAMDVLIIAKVQERVKKVEGFSE